MFGFNDYYKQRVKAHVIGGKKSYRFIFYFVLYVLLRKPDVIHNHAWVKGIKIINFLKKFYILKRKPYVIFHVHGSDVRGKGKAVFPIIDTADKILCSTNDNYQELLLIQDQKDKIEFIPNPVDPNLFYPPNYDTDLSEQLTNYKERDGKALYIRNFLPVVYPYDFMDKVHEFCSKHNLELTVIDRIKDVDLTKPFPATQRTGDFISFDKMGDEFRKYEYFLDFKGVEPNLSKTAIEAFACGCKIVHESFKVYTKDEIEIQIGNERFYEFYKELIAKIYNKNLHSYVWEYK